MPTSCVLCGAGLWGEYGEIDDKKVCHDCCYSLAEQMGWAEEEVSGVDVELLARPVLEVVT